VIIKGVIVESVVMESVVEGLDVTEGHIYNVGGQDRAFKKGGV